MRRRDFGSLIGGMVTASIVWPSPLSAQQKAMSVVGWLSIVSSDASPALPYFRQGLAENGYVEGRNLTIEYRFAEFHPERLPDLAKDLVQKNVSVIAAVSGLPSALAAKSATASLPIIFILPGDPVQAGLVASLNRPEGNLTGVTAMTQDIAAKQMELLASLLPRTAPVALLVETNTEAASLETSAKAAAQALGRRLILVDARNSDDFEVALGMIARENAGGLVVPDRPLFVSRHGQLASVVARYAIPTIYPPADLARSGGLMSYGASTFDLFRQAGHYVARVLAGAKPSDLPVQQPDRIELKINLKTAKALGLTIPPSILARADEVIE